MADVPNNSEGQNLFGLSTDPEFLFTNHKGFYRPRVEKRQTKFLSKLAFLNPFLSEDEKIALVTTACSPMSFFEKTSMSVWIVYIKRCLFVFTNKRIFHIPTKMNYSYRNSIAQILYADCQSIAVKERTLIVEYRNGKKEKFYYLGDKEKKKIKQLLKTVPLQGQQSVAQTRIHLCPRCTEELVEDVYACPNCDLRFKRKTECRRISIIFPGGGYFYTVHPILGLINGLGEVFPGIFLAGLFIANLIDTTTGSESGGYLMTVALVALLAIEKVMSIDNCNKWINEYIPIEKEINSSS